MNILMNLMMLSMVFVMISLSLASARRISEVLNEQSTLHNPKEPLYDVPDGSISFKHVSFKYSDTAETPVLSDINLDIKSGETCMKPSDSKLTKDVIEIKILRCCL